MSRRGHPRRYYEEDDTIEIDRRRYPNRARHERIYEDDVEYRRRKSGPPVKELERVRIDDDDGDLAPDFLRESASRRNREAGPVIVRRRNARQNEFDDAVPVPVPHGRVREREDDVYVRRSSRVRPAVVEEVERDELLIRERDRERERDRRRFAPRDDEEGIVIRRRDRSRSLPPPRGGYESEEVLIRTDRGRARSPPDTDNESDDIEPRYSRRIYYERERDESRGPRSSRLRSSSRPRPTENEEIIIRRDESRGLRTSRLRSSSRPRPTENEEIIIRRDEREGPTNRRESDVDWEEVVIQKKEEERSSPSPEPQAPRTPPPIRAPPIHQDIITHHRHIDHGFETARPRRVPSPDTRPSSRSSSFDEVEIRHRNARRRSVSREDIRIEHRGRKKSPSPPPVRRRLSVDVNNRGKTEQIVISRSRSRSVGRERDVLTAERKRSRQNTTALEVRDERDIQEEADSLALRSTDRSYIGEAYNGATKDWAIVDVPPGTKRITMDGVGGASQEISWQRYDGARKFRFIPQTEGERFASSSEEGDETDGDQARIARRYKRVKDRRDRLWTEITKNLVLKEAIERAGYEFEETEYFYYIFAFLEHDDVAALVNLSNDIRRERRGRIHEIHRERALLRNTPAAAAKPPLLLERPRTPRRRPWREERITEREWTVEEEEEDSRPARVRF